jgi:hypothetical protein
MLAKTKSKATLIEELALEMTCNSVNASCSEFVGQSKHANLKLKIKREEAYRRVLLPAIFKQLGSKRIAGDEHRYRCIVVIGAGASFSACRALKLGRDFAKKLKNEFASEGPPAWKKKKRIERLINDELSRLKKIYKLNPYEFETVLYAIGKYQSEALLERLRQVYDHRYNPSLTYEVLAHLLKHRFVDAVINFNFDELLDQAIEDELKPDEYHKILYDGEVNMDDIFFESGSLRYPLYIKPHGTISHESSLRFTDEAYFGMPKNIENLLEKLFKATINTVQDKKSDGNQQSNPKHHEEKSRKVILIALGFNMQSAEFNILLDRNLLEGSKIYYIKANRDRPKIDPRPLDTDKNGQSNLIHKVTQEVIDVDDKLDETILNIWGKISGNFHANFTPRGIERHRLIAHLFNLKRRPRDKAMISTYLWDRAYIEFALSVAKYKGFICVNQITEDRFGKYFHLALKATAKEDKDVPRNLLQLIGKFELVDWSYGAKAFTFKENVGKENLTDKNIADKLYPKLLAILGNQTTGSKLTRSKPFFYKTIRNLVKGTDTEISPKFENVYGHIFTDPIIIRTKLALELKTIQYLEEKDWDTVYAVAETGEWLLNIIDKYPGINMAGKEVVLIYADKSGVSDKLEHSKSPNAPKVTPHRIPWWLHNQHLTIFLKKTEKKEFEVLRAIYFTRRLRGSYINPVLLEDGSSDIKLLVDTYLAYLMKSENIEPLLKAEIINKEDIERDTQRYHYSSQKKVRQR